VSRPDKPALVAARVCGNDKTALTFISVLTDIAFLIADAARRDRRSEHCVDVSCGMVRFSAGHRKEACMSVLDELSPRERQVIEHVALRGLSNKLVGRKLGLSHRTVEDHRASAMKKLAVKNKVELTRLVASFS
jgi:DNA-binding NarL/FixJ family response regulator